MDLRHRGESCVAGMQTDIWDAARAMVVYDTMDHVADGVQRVDADVTDKVVELIRLKDRFTNPVNGWSDILLNLRFVAPMDVDLVPFEIQLVHKKMIILRHDLGGHDSYEQYRYAQDLLKIQNSVHQDKNLTRVRHLDV